MWLARCVSTWKLAMQILYPNAADLAVVTASALLQLLLTDTTTSTNL